MGTEQNEKHSILLPFLVCLVLLAFIGYYTYTIVTGERTPSPIEGTMAAATAGVSLLCLLLLLQLRRLYRGTGFAPRKSRVRELEVRIQELAAGKSEDVRKLKTLANQVEILSAMREISLLASQDVDFERLLNHALTLMEQVVGTREIALFLRSQEDQKVLKIRAHRIDGKTLFAGEIRPSSVDSTHVPEVARYGNVKRDETDTFLELTLPVQVDREILGAVKVKVNKEDLSPYELNHAELNLRNIISHISLAIKTPTLYDRAVIDGLTGLHTKRHLSAELAKLFAACTRLSKSLAAIMFDLDHFKKINDKHGHLTGDIVLREVASIIRQHIREYDSAYRYGGEEICVLLPDTDAHSAVSVAQRIRKAIQKLPMRGDQNQKVSVTISGGVAVYKKYMDKPEQLVAEADRALYEAKQAGRNRVKYSRPRSRTA